MAGTEDAQRDGAELAALLESARRALGAIANPISIRGLVAAIGGAVVLLLPELTNVVVELVIFSFVLVTAFVELVYALSGKRHIGRERGRIWAALRGLAALLFAALLFALVLVAPQGAAVGVSLVVVLLGLYLAVRGLIVTISALARAGTEHRGIRLTGGITAVAVGIIAVISPDAVTTGVIAGVAVAAIVLGMILVTWGLRQAEGTVSRVDPATATVAEVLWDWVRGSDIGDMRRENLGETIYYEPPERLAKRLAWWSMLVLSVAIATFAVLADSTAVVIGAMLVAPLMAPILGLAGAIVNGWRWRALTSGITVAAGVAVSVLLAYALAAWTPTAVAFDTNSQIVSRVDPTIIDMLIALAAGAAGAFATVDKRVSSSIAGVAIAVALVPPLAVVGVSLQSSHLDEAAGAFLLFLTNFVAIVLAASVVFVLTGFARHRELQANTAAILTTVIPFVALAAVILVPLMFTSEGLIQTASREDRAQTAVEQWLGEDSDMLVESIEVEPDEVTVSLIGPGSPPSPQRLQDYLEEDLVLPVAVTIRVTPVEVTHLPAAPLSEVLGDE